jgi:hypothetical protein
MAGWHLEYSADVDEANRVVYEKIFGVWKAPTAQSYKEDFEETVADLVKQKKPWAKLIDLSNWKTAAPEAIDIVGKHLAWCRRNNMVWSVNVISNPITYKILHKMFAKGGTRKISKTFRSRKEAEAFLREQGFKVGAETNAGGGAAGLFRM